MLYIIYYKSHWIAIQYTLTQMETDFVAALDIHPELYKTIDFFPSCKVHNINMYPLQFIL